MRLHGLVRQVIATWLLLTFLPNAVIACGVAPNILLRRHLVEVVGESLVVKVDYFIHRASALIAGNRRARRLSPRVRIQRLILIVDSCGSLNVGLWRALEEYKLRFRIISVCPLVR